MLFAMHSISSRYRKPKGRMSKRKKAACENAKKRYLYNSSNDTNDNNECANMQSNNISESTMRENTKDFAMQSPTFSIVHESACACRLQKVPINSANSPQIQLGKTYGYSTNLELTCKNSKHSYGTTHSSFRMSGNRQFDINKKLDAFLSIGKGHAALETLCK